MKPIYLITVKIRIVFIKFWTFHYGPFPNTWTEMTIIWITTMGVGCYEKKWITHLTVLEVGNYSFAWESIFKYYFVHFLFFFSLHFVFPFFSLLFFVSDLSFSIVIFFNKNYFKKILSIKNKNLVWHFILIEITMFLVSSV